MQIKLIFWKWKTLELWNSLWNGLFLFKKDVSDQVAILVGQTTKVIRQTN